jgi:hypothetical protein
MKTPNVVLALTFACLGLAAPVVAEEAYNPKIDPADFTTKIDNPLFSLPVGRTLVFEAKTEDGLEHVEIRVRDETRTIMGVKTIVYNDRVLLDGKLHEETSDYLAQDKDGNVWYFGETVDNYEDGKFKDHHGGWIAGVDGAMPGIWIKGKQVIGDEYRQEYKKGDAEDMAKVVATDATVKVPAGEYTGCTKIYEWNPLDPESKAIKYYCPEARTVVLEEELKDKVRVELISATDG